MQRSWISQYDSGVPATIEYPDWTVPDLLRRSAARFPDSSALLFYGKTMSFRRSGAASIHWRNSRSAQGRHAYASKRRGQCTSQNLAMATGSSIILLPRFHADEAVKTIHKCRVTIFSGVPMMFSW